MKRSHIEISDDEWDNLSFNPDRVLKPSNPPSPPPIESFAFRSSSELQPVADVSSDDSLLAEVENFDGNLLQDLEDDDVEETTAVRLPSTGRGRKFVVDEDSDCEVVQVKEEEKEEEEEEIEEMVEEEEDVVGKALQNCAKISAELRRELYGSASTVCDRYSEVEASSVRIVTQVR